MGGCVWRRSKPIFLGCRARNTAVQIKAFLHSNNNNYELSRLGIASANKVYQIEVDVVSLYKGIVPHCILPFDNYLRVCV